MPGYLSQAIAHGQGRVYDQAGLSRLGGDMVRLAQPVPR
jgi:hypothetical protein